MNPEAAHFWEAAERERERIRAEAGDDPGYSLAWDDDHPTLSEVT